jgi:hypothetical protein|tara:strand:+ start:2796 stop:2987 length:192 start_codon:yes stop_codon:yes gene_type:complete
MGVAAFNSPLWGKRVTLSGSDAERVEGISMESKLITIATGPLLLFGEETSDSCSSDHQGPHAD